MGVSFEDIQKANATINTTNIKGKGYAEVNQRIKAFRMIYPAGRISTEMIKNENGVCIFRATVFDEDINILATGTAYEKENSTFINKTSYIENCETSAVGRALGMAGFGIDTSVSSAEEVANAIQQQDDDEGNQVINEGKKLALKASIENNNISDSEVTTILVKYGIKDISEIKMKDYGRIIADMQAIVKKR